MNTKSAPLFCFRARRPLTRALAPQIATKVEIFTGTLPPGEADLRKVVMRRLGHLSFDRFAFLR